MKAIACPQCGADVVFRSAALPARVCDQCRTIVVRYQNGAEAMGTVAELPFDVSPLRIGTRGEWEGMAFEIVGRMRWSWTDGAWNEWMLALTDGSTRWLGEAMGQYMMMAQKALEGNLASVIQRLMQGETVAVGQNGHIDGTVYQLVDLRTVTCVSCEGELPFTAPTGWEMLNADFRSGGGDFASFQKDRRDNHLYVGRYVDLADLKPTDLRALPGWDVPAYAR